LLLAGCAGVPEQHGVWRADEVAAVPGESVLLIAGHAPVGSIATANARMLIEVLRRLEQVSGTRPAQLMIASGKAPNAFISLDDQEPVVTLTLPMLQLLGGDADATAALIGHELAHLTLRHRDTRKAREASNQETSDLMAVAFALIGIPFGSAIAEAAAGTIERGHSRDEEREADELGLDYLRQAGFDPGGALRLHRKLADSGQGVLLPFLSTHPSAAERVEAMRRRTGEAGPPASAGGR
jgi:Zn-dependent protease with chaperone function